MSRLILTVASPQVPALLEDDQSSSSDEDEEEDEDEDEDEKKPSEEGSIDRKVLHMFKWHNESLQFH